jgi:hypothetical protein
MRTAVSLVVLSASLGTLVATGTPAEAATYPIQLGKIQYDTPGGDYANNTAMNGEWVQIKNTSTRAISLTGWTLRDAQAHVYSFGTFSLGAGKAVVVRSGKGTNTSATRYWQQTWYVWNNAGDTALLKNASGVNQDVCRWTTITPGYKLC